jgi:ATP-dependent 26S proteasome regulatory subunit
MQCVCVCVLTCTLCLITEPLYGLCVYCIYTHCAGKTLLARALASNINATFLKVVASAIVDKYIGESARVVREMFGYAKDHQVRYISVCVHIKQLLL